MPSIGDLISKNLIVTSPASTDYYLLRDATDGTTKVISHDNVLSSNSPPYDKTIFVGTFGTSGNTGRNPSFPKSSIQAALDAADALSPTSGEPASVQVLDGGNYTGNIEQPDNVHIHAPLASLYGTITLGDNSLVEFHRVRATADSQEMITKPIGQTGTTYLRINEVDGTGPAIGEAPGFGSRTSSFCIRNRASGGILQAWVPKLWVSADGRGFGSTNPGNGHGHLVSQDMYAAGDNALLVAANIANSDMIVIFGHMRKFGGNHTGTVGIKMGSSGKCAAVGTQIILDVPYDVTTNSNRDLFIVCPDLQGTPIGTARVEFSRRRMVQPDMPTEADIANEPPGTYYYDTTAGNVVKVVT